MTTNKRKKVVKYRGTTYHGGGHRKKRRGAGSRGGRGRAGSGKRGKAKKQSWEPLGKKGFAGKNSKSKTINVSALTDLAQGKEELNLTALGYNKLLGTGNIKSKLNITVSKFSAKAEEKINGAGGSINSTKETKKEVEE